MLKVTREEEQRTTRVLPDSRILKVSKMSRYFEGEITASDFPSFHQRYDVVLTARRWYDMADDLEGTL